MPRTELQCDVLVTGGGAAGVAAAVAASRHGARVVLAERNGYLGGTASAAEVGTICGLYLQDSAGQTPQWTQGGFPREFASAVQHSSNVKPLRVRPGLWVLPCSGPLFSRTCDHLLANSESMTVILHATVHGAHTNSGWCEAVDMLAWNEPLVVKPKVVVDCTGEATTALLAGGQVDEGLSDQSPALVFTIDKVSGPLDATTLLVFRKHLRDAVESGRLPELCEHLALIPSRSTPDRLKLKLNLRPASEGASTWAQITTWEREARRLVYAVHDYLANSLQSFQHSRLAGVAPQLGVRSGRRLQGLAALNDADVLNATKRPDSAARGAWPMERWGEGLRPEMAFLPEGDYYDIPLGCLRARNLENLWAAGRCMSSSASAMSSARVIGTSMATGWAAGTGAAFQAQHRSPEDALPILAKQMSQ